MIIYGGEEDNFTKHEVKAHTQIKIERESFSYFNPLEDYNVMFVFDFS